MTVGILDYAWYIPELRIGREQYTRAWGTFPADLVEKAVADLDEDVLTMAVESAKEVLRRIDPASIDLLCIASTTFPYAYRMVAGTLVDALGLRRNVFCSEHSQSVRGGTEAFLVALAMIRSQDYKKALVIATDAPRADMRDAVERGLGAASVAFVLGEGEILAEVESQASCVYEHLGERFRLPDAPCIEDLGMRVYHRDVLRNSIGASVNGLLEKLARKPGDYEYLAFQQTDDAREVAMGLGFARTQVDPAFIMSQVGDTGASSALLSLASVLNVAEPDDLILVASCAPGAGSDAISLRTTLAIKTKVRRDLVQGEKKHLDYVEYLKIKEAVG